MSGGCARAFCAALMAAALLAGAPRSAAQSTDASEEPRGSKWAHDGNYFYHALPYGSDELISPMRLILNGGFGILQLDNRDNRLTTVSYGIGTRNLFINLANPVRSIQAEGWGTFFKDEIIPLNLDPNHAYYWPNYNQHLIGGGMSSRMMEEWFRAHGSNHPTAWTVATMATYHTLNEVVENNDFRGWRPDPVADMYFFNWEGILLFRSDRVCDFFANTLHMADWSFQPLIDPSDGSLENGGQNFALRYLAPGFKRTYLFYHFGTHGEFGLSWRRDNGDAFSIGGGVKAGDLVKVSQVANSVSLAVSGGMFYDRNNSLMASLLFARTKDYRMRLNIYPGLLHLGGHSPGLVLGMNRGNTVLMGIQLGHSSYIPVGLAAIR